MNDMGVVLFFFKQKTAYEIKECDWSSDVCSSDLFIQYFFESRGIYIVFTYKIMTYHDTPDWFDRVCVDRKSVV